METRAEGSDARSESEHPDAYGRLGALMSRLHAYGLETDLRRGELVVINPKVPGCCVDLPRAADTITCRPREDDGGRLWFHTSWGEPIAQANHIIDAALTVATTLRAPTPQGSADE
ncbi:hypothetical protein [Actinomadura roseirufa]|uniref:hypothetical protein n=1 Tax=Actinomadura roseirufa TaxID=2094049 RepID=UPI0010412CC8|nr:hypothetical protein [Actinomadura roseirufa]